MLGFASRSISCLEAGFVGGLGEPIGTPSGHGQIGPCKAIHPPPKEVLQVNETHDLLKPLSPPLVVQGESEGQRVGVMLSYIHDSITPTLWEVHINPMGAPQETLA